LEKTRGKQIDRDIDSENPKEIILFMAKGARACMSFNFAEATISNISNPSGIPGARRG
jgi:hypothetical protein